MASLESMPNELKNNVFRRLAFSDILNLAKTSKELYLVCQPAIFRNVWIGRSEVHSRPSMAYNRGFLAGRTAKGAVHINESRQLKSFLHALIANPELGRLVANVKVNHVDKEHEHDEDGLYGGLGISLDDYIVYAGAIDALKAPGAEHWKSAIAGSFSTLLERPWSNVTLKEHQIDALVSLILYQCTEVRDLSIRLDLLGWNPWLMSLLEQASDTSESNGGLKALGQLSRVSICWVDWTIAAPEEEAPLIHSIINTLYKLPSLQSLTVGPDEHSLRRVEWESRERQQQSVPAMSEILPVAAKLTTLRLLRSRLPPQDLKLMLQSTPNLENLEYDSNRNTGRFDRCLDLTLTKEAFNECQDTLQTIILSHPRDPQDYDNPHEYKPFKNSLGSLCDFTALVSLEVSFAMLFGHDYTWSHGPEYPDLASYLPSRLRRLKITTDAWEELEYNVYPAYPGYPASSPTMVVLKKFFAGEELAAECQRQLYREYKDVEWERVQEPTWKTATPKLKEFSYSKCRAGSWRDHSNPLGPRCDLIRMCENQGIKCDVHVEGMPFSSSLQSPTYFVYSPYPGRQDFSLLSPTSPHHSPTSPQYSPSPSVYSPTSPQYSPSSPVYSPPAQSYPMPCTPTWHPDPHASPPYSPTSPAYSPASPMYSPSSPKYYPAPTEYSPGSPRPADWPPVF
ncbi:unnamed protein product [Periconia digitata]|uniref:F-box domain-containing protein n=1 Tax=Periconia digitata TaxID=1303443 RepID=A0A9W4UFQ6_9PLEO|nr:unnamed protein product [Periconia digitata]